MQGYDSVSMNVDGEVGGNDQTFNMLAGRTLMKDLQQKEKFVIAGKLLTDNSGKKMGKTEGNMIAFSDSAEDMFGKVMRWTDGMIVNGFELCTRIPMEEVRQIEADLAKGENPRDAKLRLAFEITKTFLGEESAKQGQSHFETVIQSKDKPDEIPELTPSDLKIVTVLVEAGFVASNSEARQNISGGGVRVNDEKVEDVNYEVKSGDVIQKGKRFFVKIV
jgi:tyrosyl-tRNA synthetase